MISSCADRERLSLPAQRRLRRKADFDGAYARGERFGNGHFSIVVCGNAHGKPRLGLAVGTKVAGNSVQRNRLRRLIREFFRLHQREIAAFDLVVSVRGRARDLDNAQLRASLAELWDKVRTRCAP